MSLLTASLPAATDAALLGGAVQRLAEARTAHQRAKQTLAALEGTFRQQPEVLATLDTLAAAQTEQETADADLRTLLLDLHAASGQTRFDPAGEIRLVQTPVYLVEEAVLLDEVAAVMPDLIVRQVDRRRLEKRLRHEPQAQIPGVVEVIVAPKVFLNRTLDRPPGR